MARKKNKTPKVRLSLEVSERTKDRLLACQDASGADSMTEVIRRSLAVYEACLANRLPGGRTILESSRGICTEIVLV